MKSVSIKVTGKVQGVFYRQSTLEKAHELNLNGFVKNMPDGSVYIEAEGKEADVNALVEWCKRGPKHAFVTNVSVSEMLPQGYEGFEIR